MNILILTEAGKGIGMGHFSRCTTLAEGFTNFGHEVSFYLRGNCNDRICNNNTNIHWLDWFNLDLLGDLFSNYQIVIIDSYEASDNILKQIAYQARFSVFLIDSQLKYYPKDLVFFPSIYYEQMKDQVSALVETFGGINYLLFSKFLIEKRTFECRKEVKKIGISIGGDTDALLINKIANIVNLNDKNVKIIIFGSDKIFSGENIVNRGFLKKDTYYEEIQKCDIVIVNGGQSLNECLALSIPTVSLVIVENQYVNANSWTKMGVTSFIETNDKNFKTILNQELINSYSFSFRKGIVEKLNAIVNIDGPIKAAKIIISKYNHKN